MKEWNEQRIQDFINNKVEESLTLDYKAAGALEQNAKKKREITKDVSAMANSAGGVIIYGVKEHKGEEQGHLPESIDPIDGSEISKEWLEHVISNIRPNPNVTIYPIRISGSERNGVVYVVDIPQGSTAHQAQDLRYYRRYNFESVPMVDYEIKDILNRKIHPEIKIEFEVLKGHDSKVLYQMHVINDGSVYAKYVNIWIKVPRELRIKSDDFKLCLDSQLDSVESYWTNIHKDEVARLEGMPEIDRGHFGSVREIEPKAFYISRYDPILPGMSKSPIYRSGLACEDIDTIVDKEISWGIFADNAPYRYGKTKIRDLLKKPE